MILKLDKKHKKNGALQSLYKSIPWDDLDLFYGKVNLGHLTFKWGKLFKCHLKGKTGSKLANGLKMYDFEKDIDSRGYTDTALGLCILPF